MSNTVVGAAGQTCQGCQHEPANLGANGLGVLCSECWTYVPNTVRLELRRAQTECGHRPVAGARRLNAAVDVALGHVAVQRQVPRR